MTIIIIRTLIIYAALLVTMRLLGKRQLGEMELSEFVVAALAADLAANPLQDPGIPLLYGLTPIAVLCCCELLISELTLRSIRLKTLLCGRPSLLILDGKIDQREMKRNCFTVDELMQELRSSGVLDVTEVEYAILETDGELNVLPYPAHAPATASQLGVETQRGGYPCILISDGRVLSDNLRHMGRDERWLFDRLREHGVTGPKEVYLLTLDQNGGIYLAVKERRA